MKMITTSPKSLFLAGALVVCALPAFGQYSRFYAKIDLGGNITPDANLNEFFGPVAPDTKVKFDPGFRSGLVGGYQITDWFSGELELGFMENSIHEITGADRVHDAWYANVPFMVNAKLQYPNSSKFIPYIGAGVGFSESLMDVSQISLNGTSLNGYMWDTVFAWQGFAGLRYKINDQMGLSIEYHYFYADGANWQADFTSGTASDTMSMGHTQTHAFSLAFDFRF